MKQKMIVQIYDHKDCNFVVLFFFFFLIVDMQKQEHFERYTPQFPLPVDITSMSREDTVCQFCGVSYLIHNEIKALEEKCQKLEADLVYYAGISSREAKLEQTLQNERTRIADLESTITINSHK
jgi:hypothetical protein